jgi:hypothetical protein
MVKAGYRDQESATGIEDLSSNRKNIAMIDCSGIIQGGESMKKCMLIALIAIFTLSVLGAVCHAQLDRTMTNTSKKGSLMIWPLIKTNLAEGQDTVITLSNDYYKKVKVKCFYRFPFPCSHEDWVFTLTPNQPVSWQASTGKGLDGRDIPLARGSPPALGDGARAELKCWAVNEAEDQQIAWNWLSGEALVFEGVNQIWQYPAWRFAVNSSTTGAAAGVPGKILLTGDSGNYDACPTALLFPFIKQTPTTASSFPPGTVDNLLTLMLCNEDFVDDLNTVVYTQLQVRDENGGTQAATFVCVGCGLVDPLNQWFSESLISPKLHIASSVDNPFVNLATPGGSIYVHGTQRAVSCSGSAGAPLLGVMSRQFNNPTGPFAGEPPTAVGPAQAYIKNANDMNTTIPISITWD